MQQSLPNVLSYDPSIFYANQKENDFFVCSDGQFLPDCISHFRTGIFLDSAIDMSISHRNHFIHRAFVSRQPLFCHIAPQQVGSRIFCVHSIAKLTRIIITFLKCHKRYFILITQMAYYLAPASAFMVDQKQVRPLNLHKLLHTKILFYKFLENPGFFKQGPASKSLPFEANS